MLAPRRGAITLTVTTSSGEKFNGMQDHLDEFTVSLWDSEGWYHSWPCREVKVKVHDPIAAHIKLLPKYTQADVHNLFAYLETLK